VGAGDEREEKVGCGGMSIVRLRVVCPVPRPQSLSRKEEMEFEGPQIYDSEIGSLAMKSATQKGWAP